MRMYRMPFISDLSEERRLRIIGGEFRGKRLSSFRGVDLRPTTDRIRESIFDILSHQLPGSIVLDLFAGTGALGLEALSRGATFGVFVDQNKKALSVIERNIRSLDIGTQTKMIRWNIGNNLNFIRRVQRESSRLSPGDSDEADRWIFSLVFIDPPYNRQLVGQTLRHLHSSGSLAKGAVVVVEHSPSESIPEDAVGFTILDQREYGQAEISFLNYVGS